MEEEETVEEQGWIKRQVDLAKGQVEHWPAWMRTEEAPPVETPPAAGDMEVRDKAADSE